MGRGMRDHIEWLIVLERPCPPYIAGGTCNQCGSDGCLDRLTCPNKDYYACRNWHPKGTMIVVDEKLA